MRRNAFLKCITYGAPKRTSYIHDLCIIGFISTHNSRINYCHHHSKGRGVRVFDMRRAGTGFKRGLQPALVKIRRNFSLVNIYIVSTVSRFNGHEILLFISTSAF